ncbi:MAG: DUF366 family protein [Planctomycetota bacterium]|jgi:hypothetical protein
MKVAILDGDVRYDGLQLSTGFIDQHAPGETDALVLFVGEADVPVEHLVDKEDAEAGAFIYSPSMAHAIIEHKGLELSEAVWRQRMLGRLAAQWISSRSGSTVEVRGDDLFVGEGKLSVSVATGSPRGCLIHLGVNVDIEGTPVRTAGLRDLRIPPTEFLQALARLYAEEMASAQHATTKVRSVR